MAYNIFYIVLIIIFIICFFGIWYWSNSGYIQLNDIDTQKELYYQILLKDGGKSIVHALFSQKNILCILKEEIYNGKSKIIEPSNVKEIKIGNDPKNLQSIKYIINKDESDYFEITLE